MKLLRIAIILTVVVCLSVPVMALKHKPEERGKALFMDKDFAGGSKACNSCHPNGRGLKKAGTKKKFNIMGKRQNSLEEAVNFCIVNANKGKAIKKDSDEMKDIVSYIKSLGKKETPGYGESPTYY
jgi:cytochrome c